jgi:hypothetical protein
MYHSVKSELNNCNFFVTNHFVAFVIYFMFPFSSFVLFAVTVGQFVSNLLQNLLLVYIVVLHSSICYIKCIRRLQIKDIIFYIFLLMIALEMFNGIPILAWTLLLLFAVQLPPVLDMLRSSSCVSSASISFVTNLPHFGALKMMLSVFTGINTSGPST